MSSRHSIVASAARLVLPGLTAVLLLAVSPVGAQPQGEKTARLDDAIREAHAAADAAREGGDRTLARRMNGFAKSVVHVREQLAEPQSTPDRLRRELNRLSDDSRAIERDLAKSRLARPAAADAWARVVRTLEAFGGGAAGTSGSWSGSDRPTDRPRDRELNRVEAASGERDARDRPGPGGLPGELEQCVRRAETLADQADLGDARALLDHFAERTSKLTDQFGTLSVEERQDRAKRLLDEARQVQQSLTRQNASPDLVDEWNKVIDVLTRMGGIR